MGNTTVDLQDMRKAKGLSSKELARQVGIAQTAIWAYENGDKKIPETHAGRLAEFFDVAPEALLR